MPEVTIDMGGIGRIRNALSDFENKPPFDRMLTQWAARYRSFAQLRYARYSRGGGDWPPLKRNTIIARERRRITRARQHSRSINESPEAAARRLLRAQQETRRQVKKIAAGAGNAAILRDTGIVFAALQPRFVGAPGQFEQPITNGVRVGFGGPGKHGIGERASVADIAFFHDQGAGRLPRRAIIVSPDQSTIEGMQSDLARALRRAGQ